MKIKLMTPLEYIARQNELMDIHMEAQRLTVALSQAWCWRRDLANNANRRMFEMIRYDARDRTLEDRKNNI